MPVQSLHPIIDQIDKWGYTPLHDAVVGTGKSTLVQKLLLAGAQVDRKTIQGVTALMLVCIYYSDIETIKFLIEAGANIDSTAEGGLTPLMCACISGNVSAVKALLEAGADLSAVTIASRKLGAQFEPDLTALDMAFMERHHDIHKLLKESKKPDWVIPSYIVAKESECEAHSKLPFLYGCYYKCPDGCDMVWTNESIRAYRMMNVGGSVRCNECRSNVIVSSNHPIFHCAAHHYDYCMPCAEKRFRALQEEAAGPHPKLQSVFSCYCKCPINNCEMVWTDDYEAPLGCDSCLSDIPPYTPSWHCLCNSRFDYCVSCAEKSFSNLQLARTCTLGSGEIIYGKTHYQCADFEVNGNYIYIGDAIGGVAHGNGKMTFISGKVHRYLTVVFEGEFKNGSPYGSGKIVYPYGAVYEGQWKSFMKHGNGKFTFNFNATTQFVYEGMWKDDKKHGQGRSTNPGGVIFCGDYENDLEHGFGTETFPDGSIFEGQWFGGSIVMKERGKFTNRDGEVEYDGVWEDKVTPLHVACSKGDIALVQKLLLTDPKLEFTDYKGETPLMCACDAEGTSAVTIIKALLASGAKMDHKTYESKWGTALIKASSFSSIECMKALLGAGANVNETNCEGATALIVAARKRKNVQAIEALLNAGADVNKHAMLEGTALNVATVNHDSEVMELLSLELEGNRQAAAIINAASNGNLLEVKRLLNERVDVNSKMSFDKTPLFFACENNHVEIAGLLIDRGADMYCKDFSGKTPLSYCRSEALRIELVGDMGKWSELLQLCKNGDIDNVVQLLDTGADINFIEKSAPYATAFYWACFNGHDKLAAALLDRGADITIKDHEGSPILHLACKNGHENVAGLLVDRGMLVTSTDATGWTPMYWACKNDHHQVVTVLLDKVSDIPSKDSLGFTALHWASCWNKRKVLSSLLERNADYAFIKNDDGKAALHWASENGHVEVAAILLNKNAEIGSVDIGGKTALHWSCANGHLQVVTLLLDKMADVSSKDLGGWTPLHCACDAGHEQVAAILLDNDADLMSKNNRGRSPLDLCTRDDILQTLMEKCRDSAAVSKIQLIINEKRRIAAAEKLRLEEEERKRLAEEERVRIATEEKLRIQAEEKRRFEAEEKIRLEAEEKIRLEEEEKLRLAAEENRRIELVEKARREAEIKIRLEEEERIRVEEEKKMRLAAEEKRRLEAEEKERRAAAEKIRLVAEKKLRLEAEEKLRLEVEQKRRELAAASAAEIIRLEAEEKLRLEAEEKIRLEAEEKRRIAAEAAAAENKRREEAEKIRAEAQEKRRLEAEEKLRLEEEEKNRIAMLDAALASGSGEWNRSKMIVVGQGRSGKSAFANSLAGLEFEETDSTIGIDEFTCSVSHMSQGVQPGSWTLCKKPENELESALARSAASRGKKKELKNKDDFVNSLRESRGLRHGTGFSSELSQPNVNAHTSLPIDASKSSSSGAVGAANDGSAAHRDAGHSIVDFSEYTRIFDDKLAKSFKHFIERLDSLSPMEKAKFSWLNANEISGQLMKPDFKRTSQTIDAIKSGHRPSTIMEWANRRRGKWNETTGYYQQRLFKIIAGKLAYFDSQGTSGVTPKKGEIDLSIIECIKLSVVWDAPAFSFDLVSHDRHYTLVATDEENMFMWLYALRDEIARIKKALLPPSPIPVLAKFAAPAPVKPRPNEKKFLVDKDTFMKCLSNETQSESGLLLSVFDYGGQEVFDVMHHLFLTQYGVYALCFNMQWLVSRLGSDNDRDECLAYLKKWLNSIVLHTYDTKTKKSAPVILIGTHRDKVSDPGDHNEISALLQREFGLHFAWPDILQNSEGEGKSGRENLCFFPVSNVDGRARCSVTQQAIKKIEDAIEKAEYTKKKVPLSWLSTIDLLRKTDKCFLTLEELKLFACESCNVNPDHVEALLKFLREMGTLLWIDEPGLRDIVILDAIKYFVKPATLIICNHGYGKGGSLTRHYLPVHNDCARLHQSEWKSLVAKGILITSLLDTLWNEFAAETDRLLHLMVRFGLLVAISDTESGSIDRYIVPTLLSNVAHSDILKPREASATKIIRACYFSFSLDPDLAKEATLDADSLKSNGFMPSGLFERLLGRCIQWATRIAQDGKLNLPEMILNKDRAEMSFGAQSFCLTPLFNLNCIRIESEGMNPLTVTRRLRELCEEVIQECMQSLFVFEAVMMFPLDAVDPYVLMETFERGEHSLAQLVTINAIRSAADRKVPLKRGNTELLNMAALNDPMKYGCWLESYGIKDKYDVFLSYRWGNKDFNYDQELVRSLFDYFGYYSVGTELRRVETFQDEKRLQTGKQFDKSFAKSLVNSSVVVPVCSHFALKRMTAHNPHTVDNVLLEWLLTMECQSAATGSRVQFVLPLLFGEIKKSASNDDVVIGDLWASGILGTLSTCVPVATIAKCKELLLENNITPSTKLDFYTVKSFIEGEFLSLLACKAWDIKVGKIVSDVSGLIYRKVVEAEVLLSALESKEEEPRLSNDAFDENVNVFPPLVVPASHISSTSPASPASPSSYSVVTDKSVVSEDIWAVLQNSNKSINHTALLAYLDEVGADSPRDILHIATNKDVTTRVCSYLKKLPCERVKADFEKLCSA